MYNHILGGPQTVFLSFPLIRQCSLLPYFYTMDQAKLSDISGLKKLQQIMGNCDSNLSGNRFDEATVPLGLACHVVHF